MTKIIEKTESLIRRMRWKAHFFLNFLNNREKKQSFGFKATKLFPFVKEMKNFEENMLKLRPVARIFRGGGGGGVRTSRTGTQY